MPKCAYFAQKEQEERTEKKYSFQDVRIYKVYKKNEEIKFPRKSSKHRTYLSNNFNSSQKSKFSTQVFKASNIINLQFLHKGHET